MALVRRFPTLCMVALAGTLAFGQTAHAGAGSSCATDSEAEALRVRALQNQLMVAALTCDEADRYDAFIGRFESALVIKGRIMAAYFERRHGGKRAKRVVDDYVTTQANQYSLDSMRDRGGFCRAASETLTVLLGGGEDILLAKAVTIPVERVAGPLACLREARVTAPTPRGKPSGG